MARKSVRCKPHSPVLFFSIHAFAVPVLANHTLPKYTALYGRTFSGIAQSFLQRTAEPPCPRTCFGGGKPSRAASPAVRTTTLGQDLFARAFLCRPARRRRHRRGGGCLLEPNPALCGRALTRPPFASRHSAQKRFKRGLNMILVRSSDHQYFIHKNKKSCLPSNRVCSYAQVAA